MRLSNKVAIITGGGSGIGRAASYLFAKEGAKVVVAERTLTTGEETAATINSNGGEAISIHTDVSIASEVEKLVKATMDKFGKIDILYNNAGVGGQATVDTMDESLWDSVYATNIKGHFLMAKYVVPEMKKAQAGVIINTASFVIFRPLIDIAAYLSSKGAVATLTKALALELAPHNIRVNCISPGLVDTPMLGLATEEHRKAWVSAVPMGRVVKPEEIAYAALYLASDEASIVTGTNLNVDGGSAI
ncbi:SDR family NAD(P)-dependent oxidoreductase [Chloroflexota bacterium]